MGRWPGRVAASGVDRLPKKSMPKWLCDIVLLPSLLFILWSCGGQKKETNDTEGGDEAYYHPATGTTAKTTVTSAAVKTVDEAVKEETSTSIALGTTIVSIPDDTFSVTPKPLLTSYGGGFANQTSFTLLSQPVTVTIHDESGAILERTKATQDIKVKITTSLASKTERLVVLIKEDPGKTTEKLYGLTASKLSRTGIKSLSDGRIELQFVTRHTNFAVAAADTGGKLPAEYVALIEPPIDPTTASASSPDPAQITLSFQGSTTLNKSYYLHYALKGTSTSCANATAIEATATDTSGSYSYTVAGLKEEATYIFRLCGANSRESPDVSYPGYALEVNTPKRVVAAIYDAPSDPSNAQVLDITIGGDNVKEYQYALLKDVTTCTGATYSDWLAVSKKITSTLTTSGTMLLCVLGRKDSTNAQQTPTTTTWTIDTVAPTFSSIALANDAVDLYINSSEKTSSNALVGDITATGYDYATYSLVSSATTCDSSLTYSSTAPKSSDCGSDGTYKVCVKLADKAGNITYGGASSTFTVDTVAPVFTSVALAGDAIGGYINLAETANTNDLVDTLTGTGYTDEAYRLITSATTCDSSVNFSSDVPQSDSSDFSADGTYKVCVRITDAAENHTYGVSSNIYLDKTVPVFTSLTISGDAADGYVSSSERSSTTSLLGTLTASGYDTIQYKLAANATTCDAMLVYGTAPAANSGDFGADGTYKICVVLTDTAGNPTVYGTSSTFTLDTTAPTFGSLTAINDAADLYINSSERSSASALVSAVVGGGYTSATYKLATTATTCNVSLTYGAIPASNSADFSVNGTYKVCVKLADAAGNTTYNNSSTITLDATAPSFSSITLANDATDGFINLSESGNANNLVSAAAGSGFDTAAYKLVSSATTCNVALVYGGIPTSNSADFGGVDGAYKVCVKLTDNAGNTPAYGESEVITRDATAPVFNSLSLAAGDAADGYINVDESDNTTDLSSTLDATGYDTYGYKLVTSATSCDGALTYSTSMPKSNAAEFTSQTTFKICVKLTDFAGNITYNSSTTFTYDTVYPVFTSIARANDAADFYINLAESALANDLADTLSASGYNTDTYKLVSTATTCDGALVYGAMPKGSSGDFGSDGTYKVCVKLADNAGNITYGYSGNITLDKTVPAFTDVDLANDATDTYINLAERSNATVLVAAATGTGYDTVAYSLATNATTCDGALVYGAIPASNSGSFGADGAYKICVKLSDTAGNPDAFGASDPFTLDIAPPTFTSATLGNDAADNYINSAERSNTNDLVSMLSAADYDSVNYKLVTSGTTCDVALTYGSLPKSNSGDFGSDGTYKVCVKLADNAGNTAYGATSNLTLDTAAPTFTSINRVNDAADSYINNSETGNNTDIVGGLTASSYTSDTYKLVTSATSCDVALVYGVTPQSSAVEFSANGTYKVCVKLADAAGNTTYGSSGTITLDKDVPSFMSITLQNDAVNGYINLAESATGTDMAGAAVGSNYDTAGYKLVTSATTCDGALTYGASVPKNNSGDFTGEGSFKICVKLSDNAGNTPAYGSSASFVYDSVKPTTTITTSGTLTSSSTGGDTTTIEGTASDATSGLSSVEISVQEGTGSCLNSAKTAYSEACPNWITAAGTTSWSISAYDRMFMKSVTYNLSTRATDVAGNIQTTLTTGSFVWSAPEGTDSWNATTTLNGDGNSDDVARAVAVDSNGNVYVVGSATGATDIDWRIKKYTKYGVEVTSGWNLTVGDSGVADVPYGAAVDSSNNLYIVGTKYNGSDYDWWLKKYGSDGTEVSSGWDKVVDGNGADDIATAVAVDTSNNVYVVGYGTNIVGGASGQDWWIKKYNSAGTQSCELKLDPGSDNQHDQALAVAVNSSTGKLYVAGYDNNGGDVQWYIRKLSTTDCSLESTATGNSGGTDDKATGIKLDSSGNVYVVGTTSFWDSDIWIRKYSANLIFQAEVNADVSGSHGATSIAIDGNNKIYVGGYKDVSGNEDFWLRQFNTSLTEDVVDWPKVISGSGGGADRIQALAISQGTNDSNNIYMVGYGTNMIDGTSQKDWVLLKYSGE